MKSVLTRLRSFVVAPASKKGYAKVHPVADDLKCRELFKNNNQKEAAPPATTKVNLEAAVDVVVKTVDLVTNDEQEVAVPQAIAEVQPEPAVVVNVEAVDLGNSDERETAVPAVMADVLPDAAVDFVAELLKSHEQEASVAAKPVPERAVDGTVNAVVELPTAAKKPKLVPVEVIYTRTLVRNLRSQKCAPGFKVASFGGPGHNSGARPYKKVGESWRSVYEMNNEEIIYSKTLGRDSQKCAPGFKAASFGGSGHNSGARAYIKVDKSWRSVYDLNNEAAALTR